MAGARTLLQRVCAEATAHLPTDTYLDVLAQLDLAQAQEELVAASPRRGEPDVCIGVGVNLVHGLTLASACGTPP
jgi:hypothetical protein